MCILETRLYFTIYLHLMLDLTQTYYKYTVIHEESCEREQGADFSEDY